MRYFLATMVMCCSLTAQAQQYNLTGTLIDKEDKPVIYVAVSLLNPQDSTLSFFGVSNDKGNYEIKAVKAGKYLMQVAGIGYKTVYATVNIPLSNGNSLGIMRLQEKDVALDEVEVKGEKVPVLLKKDTIEYNAGSFKVKPDASTEDLLKKLPGVEVDQAGNVRANGKDVSKVLVDGKEFFSDDPKVATKNLPADAIDKVQVFDSKSSESQFSGIDDGERDRTINLMLKDGKKHGYFGDVEAGGGTNDRYKFAGRYYRFQKKSQFAALGMLNNINQFGFSLQDYISFQGGLRGLMSGGGLNLNANSPVNFGQPVTGLITSGAAGINYTYAPANSNRFNVSYMGNGAGKKLSQQTNTRNYTDNSEFLQQEDLNEQANDFGHRLNLNWRKELDSNKLLLVNGGAGITKSNTDRKLLSSSQVQNAVLNRLDSRVEDNANGLTGNLDISYQEKLKGKFPLWKLSASGNMDKTLSQTEWNNTTFFPPTATVTDQQYQHTLRQNYEYEAATSIVRKISKGNYLEPELRAGHNSDVLQRNQGLLATDSDIDSLSPSFSRGFSWVRPGAGFRHNSEKLQYGITLRGEADIVNAALENGKTYSSSYFYALPSGNIQYDYRQNTNVNLFYNTRVNAPGAGQMLPVTDYTNPLQRFTGNPSLRPEYVHSLNVHWVKFDAFSFTSLMASLGGRYTHDKINWSRTINPDLSQDVTFANVPDDYALNGRVEYSTPIRKLGLKLSATLREQYNRGLSYVNGTLNDNNTFTHTVRLSIGNRKKDKWDAEAGGVADISSSKYSLQHSLDNTFYHYNGFAQLNWRPSDHFYFSLSANADRYDAQSFDRSIDIFLLKASATLYFLKGNRGVLTLDGFDLLNQNRSVERVSQLNYLRETTSNVIGRYFMLSFKYRLNKTGGKKPGDGIDIRINN